MLTEPFQGELLSGESVLWSGQPVRRIIFGRQDVGMLFFSLFWLAFMVFWEMGVSGYWDHQSAKKGQSIDLFMALWGIPFLLVGLYMLFGRFLHVLWRKRKIYYAVTNRRVLALYAYGQRKLIAASIPTIPVIEKSVRRDGIGMLRFGSSPAAAQWYARWNLGGTWPGFEASGFPVFADISDADRVYQLVEGLRLQAHEKPGESRRWGF